MANKWSAAIMLSKVVSYVTGLVEEHAAVLVHTLEVELILLGLWIEILVNLVPFWRYAFKFLVWGFRDQWCLSLAHLVDHLVDFYEVLSSVKFADSLFVGLAHESLWRLGLLLMGM